MTMPFSFRLALLAVVGMALTAFGVAEENPGLAALLAVGATSGWWVTEWSSRPRGLPRWATNLILVGVLISAVMRAAQGGVMVSAFNSFLASLLVIKLWERREIRDYSQILTMSLFLAVGATLNHNSLWVGVALIFLLPLLAYTSMSFQVISGAHRYSGAQTVIESSRRASLGVFSLSVACVSGLIATVVFLTVPRGMSPTGVSSFGRLVAGRVTGFSDRVTLGQGGLISESQTVVLSASFRTGDQKSLGGEGQTFYLRGAVLDEYERGEWTRSGTGMMVESSDASNGVFLTAGLIPPDPDVSLLIQQIDMRALPDGTNALFALYRPFSVSERVEEFRLVEHQSPRYRLDRTTGWFLRTGPGGPVSYETISVLGARERGSVSRRGVVSFPDPRVREHAFEVLRAAQLEPDWRSRAPEEDAGVARYFETYLKTQFEYSLDIPAPPSGRDPTEWFLRDERRGHCEYFASALAALCRSVGIDARVVTGYIATQFDDEAQRYVVRASNAHAWVEVNTASGTWRTMDGTPPADFERQHRAPQGVLVMLGRLLGDVEDLWAARVVSFDQNSQARLFGVRNRQALDSWGGWLRRNLRRGDLGSRAMRIVPTALAAGLGVATVAGLFVFLRRRRPHGDSAPFAIDPSLLRLHRTILKACAAAGLPRASSMPLRRHVAMVAERQPLVGRPLVEAADIIYLASFRGEKPSPERVKSLTRELRRSAGLKGL